MSKTPKYEKTTILIKMPFFHILGFLTILAIFPIFFHFFSLFFIFSSFFQKWLKSCFFFERLVLRRVHICAKKRPKSCEAIFKNLPELEIQLKFLKFRCFWKKRAKKTAPRTKPKKADRKSAQALFRARFFERIL